MLFGGGGWVCLTEHFRKSFSLTQNVTVDVQQSFLRRLERSVKVWGHPLTQLLSTRGQTKMITVTHERCVKYSVRLRFLCFYRGRPSLWPTPSRGTRCPGKGDSFTESCASQSEGVTRYDLRVTLWIRFLAFLQDFHQTFRCQTL